MPHDSPINKGGEVPQPQTNKFREQWHWVSRGAQQALPIRNRVLMDEYRWKYLDVNNISSVANLRKADWPNLTGISFSKSMITKVKINWMTSLLSASFKQWKILTSTSMLQPNSAVIWEPLPKWTSRKIHFYVTVK